MTYLHNELSEFCLGGSLSLHWPAVDEVTEPSGLSKGLEIIFVGFHLVLEVFTAKLVDDMFQKVKVQKIPVFAKLCPEITESCVLMDVREMIINELLMLYFFGQCRLFPTELGSI